MHTMQCRAEPDCHRSSSYFWYGTALVVLTVGFDVTALPANMKVPVAGATVVSTKELVETVCLVV